MQLIYFLLVGVFERVVEDVGLSEFASLLNVQNAVVLMGRNLVFLSILVSDLVGVSEFEVDGVSDASVASYQQVLLAFALHHCETVHLVLLPVHVFLVTKKSVNVDSVYFKSKGFESIEQDRLQVETVST